MPSLACQFDVCGRSAFIMDTRMGKVVCLAHRYWQCDGCGAEHNHDELNRYSDDFEHWLSCPGTGKILMMGFWGPVASLPSGTTWGDRCCECMGLGRCQCIGAELGKHEKCLRCDGSERCTYCQGTGLRPPSGASGAPG
jgi:hypothetical protein